MRVADAGIAIACANRDWRRHFLARPKDYIVGSMGTAIGAEIFRRA